MSGATFTDISAMEYLQQLNEAWNDAHAKQRVADCSLCGKRFKKTNVQKYCSKECRDIVNRILHYAGGQEKQVVLFEHMADFMRMKREIEEEGQQQLLSRGHRQTRAKLNNVHLIDSRKAAENDGERVRANSWACLPTQRDGRKESGVADSRHLAALCNREG